MLGHVSISTCVKLQDDHEWEETFTADGESVSDLSLASFHGHFGTQKGQCHTPDVCDVNCCDTYRV